MLGVFGLRLLELREQILLACLCLFPDSCLVRRLRGLDFLQLRLQILSELCGFGEPRLGGRGGLCANFRLTLLSLGLLFGELLLQLLLRRLLLPELRL